MNAISDRNPILPSPHYVDLRLPDGSLACRFDPIRLVLECQKRGVVVYFDLMQIITNKALDNNKTMCYDSGHGGSGAS